MKKLDIDEKTWLDLKQKYMDDWQPTENDVDWLIKTQLRTSKVLEYMQ